MSANIVQLRPHGSGFEFEGKLLGAVLELEAEVPEGTSAEEKRVRTIAFKHGLIEACGLTLEDFLSPQTAMAWRVCELLSRRRKEISAETVCSAGVRHSMLSPSHLGWLTELQHANMCTRVQAIQIADDIRAQARARKVKQQLLQEISVIDAGRFHPGRSVDALGNIIRGLATDFAPAETADVDLFELNQQWDDNLRSGQTMLVPTGIRVLDEALGGGTPRNLWGLQGQPGSGKNIAFTTMAKSKVMLDHHTTRKTKLGIVGLENGTAWLTRRWQAEDLDLAQKDIGSKALSKEEAEHKAMVDQRHFELLNRIQVYRYSGVGIGEVVRIIMRWIFENGVTEVLVDNLREFRQVGEYLAHITHVITSLRDVAGRHGIPIGLAIHDMESAVKGKEGPPNPGNMMGGKSPGALMRCVVGTWRKGPWSYRATVTKHEMGEGRWPNGPTCEFKVNYKAGTAYPEAGRMIDLETEEAKDRAELRDRSDVERVEGDERRKRLRARRAAEAAPEKPVVVTPPPAQASLLELPSTTKPEPKT